jgi:hypothetical protein
VLCPFPIEISPPFEYNCFTFNKSFQIGEFLTFLFNSVIPLFILYFFLTISCHKPSEMFLHRSFCYGEERSLISHQFRQRGDFSFRMYIEALVDGSKQDLNFHCGLDDQHDIHLLLSTKFLLILIPSLQTLWYNSSLDFLQICSCITCINMRYFSLIGAC